MNSGVNNKTSIIGDMGSAVAMNALLTGGFGTISAVKSHGGIKNAIKATKANNEVLKSYKNVIKTTNDVFTTNLKTAYNYDKYTRLAKQIAKYEKASKKLPFFTRLNNLFRKNKVTTADFTAKATAANNELTGFKTKLKNGNNIFDVVTDKNKPTALASLDSATNCIKSTKAMFKSELKDPMGFIGAGLEIFSRVTTEVIPAFKNEGVSAGIKSLGKAVAAGFTSWIADAGLSVVFRNVGATVGAVFGPVGSAVGSALGNCVGAVLSNRIVQKIFPSKGLNIQDSHDQETQPTELAQNDESQTYIPKNVAVQENSSNTSLNNAAMAQYAKQVKFAGKEKIRTLAKQQMFNKQQVNYNRNSNNGLSFYDTYNKTLAKGTNYFA